MPLSASSAVVGRVGDGVLHARRETPQGPGEGDRDDDQRRRQRQDDGQQVGAEQEQDDHEPMRPSSDESSEVSVCVSIVRTCVTSLDSREMSSPTRRRT